MTKLVFVVYRVYMFCSAIWATHSCCCLLLGAGDVLGGVVALIVWMGVPKGCCCCCACWAPGTGRGCCCGWAWGRGWGRGTVSSRSTSSGGGVVVVVVGTGGTGETGGARAVGLRCRKEATAAEIYTYKQQATSNAKRYMQGRKNKNNSHLWFTNSKNPQPFPLFRLYWFLFCKSFFFVVSLNLRNIAH